MSWLRLELQLRSVPQIRLVATLGLLLVDDNETSWQGLVRIGWLNRGGAPDPNNSLTPVSRDVLNVELIHNRIFPIGRLEFVVGYE